MQGRTVIAQLVFLILLAVPPVCLPLCINAQQLPAGESSPILRPRVVFNEPYYLTPPQLSADVETANGQYRINLINQDQNRVVRGYAVIKLGTAEEQIEAIKLRFALLPNEAMLFPLWPLAATGEYCALMIYDQRGAVIFQKFSPVKKGADINWAVNAPVNSIVSERLLKTAITSDTDTELRVQAKLSGGETESDPFFLALEVTSLRNFPGAVVSITGKGLNQRKTADLRGTSLVQFKLPDDLTEQKLSYSIIDSGGRLLAKGDADLHTLLADDYVSVSEVRPEKQRYAPGETAKMTILLQGGSPNGFRIEVQATDNKGTVFFRDMRKAETTGNAASLEFALALPAEISGSVNFSYKVFDAQSGKLFDSGDSEINVTEARTGSQ